MPRVRLRQIALVGQNIDYSKNTLCAMFDTYVAFRDPGIVPSFGGMFNILLQFGDCFLEVVSPTDEGYGVNSTSAKLLKKSNGDCGYMAILQVDDVAHTSQKLAAGGGRMVLGSGQVIKGEVGEGSAKGVKGFRVKVGDSLPKDKGTVSMINLQWHPKDYGTLMETEEQWPAHRGAEGSWLPAGNGWQNDYKRRSSAVCEEFAGIEIALKGGKSACEAMAKKWSDGLEVPLLQDGRIGVQLTGSTVEFIEAGSDGVTGIVAISVYAAPGRPKAFLGEVKFHGIRWKLVDRNGQYNTQPKYETKLGASKM